MFVLVHSGRYIELFNAEFEALDHRVAHIVPLSPHLAELTGPEMSLIDICIAGFRSVLTTAVYLADFCRSFPSLDMLEVHLRSSRAEHGGPAVVSCFGGTKSNKKVRIMIWPIWISSH